MEKNNQKSSSNNKNSQAPKTEKSRTERTDTGRDEFSRELSEITNKNIQPEENKNKPNYRRYK